jgi:thiol:disulfide interchange protein DsbA
MPFFESIIYQTRSYNFDSATRDIHDFMVEAGVDGAKWDATFNSFGVKNKSRNATMLWNAYQIDSTPMVGVGGKFTTGPHLAGSRQGTPAVIDYLVDQMRTLRK